MSINSNIRTSRDEISYFLNEEKSNIVKTIKISSELENIVIYSEPFYFDFMSEDVMTKSAANLYSNNLSKHFIPEYVADICKNYYKHYYQEKTQQDLSYYSKVSKINLAYVDCLQKLKSDLGKNIPISEIRISQDGVLHFFNKKKLDIEKAKEASSSKDLNNIIIAGNDPFYLDFMPEDVMTKSAANIYVDEISKHFAPEHVEGACKDFYEHYYQEKTQQDLSYYSKISKINLAYVDCVEKISNNFSGSDVRLIGCTDCI